MDKYIKCLINANETARESDVADFEFSKPREAVIFSHWMGAVLPIDEGQWFSLPSESEGPLPSNFDSYEEWDPLLSESIVYFDSMDFLLQRRYVLFVPPMTYSPIISNIIKKGFNPQTFILIGLNKEKYPEYDESFWKYIAGCHLRGRGYLVTKKRPYDMHGCPDIGAYKTPTIMEPLRKYGFIREGCFLVELELPLVFGEVKNNPLEYEMDSHTIVVEAKSQRRQENQAEKQLIGYLTSKENHYYFDEGYISGPDFDREHGIGVISNTIDGELMHNGCKRKTYSSLESKLRAFKQVEMLTKLVLAKNLPISLLQVLCSDKPFNKIGVRGFLNELIKALEHMTVDEICSLVREKGLNR